MYTVIRQKVCTTQNQLRSLVHDPCMARLLNAAGQILVHLVFAKQKAKNQWNPRDPNLRILGGLRPSVSNLILFSVKLLLLTSSWDYNKNVLWDLGYAPVCLLAHFISSTMIESLFFTLHYITKWQYWRGWWWWWMVCVVWIITA